MAKDVDKAYKEFYRKRGLKPPEVERSFITFLPPSKITITKKKESGSWKSLIR